MITMIAQLQRSKTVWHDLSDNTFTVASADNIDMLQSHASECHGDQSLKRSIGDSPSKSPHNLGKIGPNRSKLKLLKLSWVFICNQGASANPVPDPHTPTPSIDGFLEEPSEKIEENHLNLKY